MKSIQLYNVAVWHAEQVEKSTNDRDRNRHAEISDRFFLIAASAASSEMEGRVHAVLRQQKVMT